MHRAKLQLGYAIRESGHVTPYHSVAYLDILYLGLYSSLPRLLNGQVLDTCLDDPIPLITTPHKSL